MEEPEEGWEHSMLTEMPEIKTFLTFPKLKGESNWSSWKKDFHEFLKCLGGKYMEILDGSIKTPVEPDASQYLTITHDSVEKACYEDLMTTRQFANYAEYKAQFRAPTVSKLKVKRQELEKHNTDLQAAYQKAKRIHGTLSSQVLFLLGTCIEDTPGYIIAFETDPHKAFEKLQAHYGEPSLYLTLQAWRDWTGMRCTDNDAAGFVRRFQKATVEIQYLYLPDEISHGLERTVFVRAITDNPRYTTFLRNFRSSQVPQMYREFVKYEEMLRCFPNEQRGREDR